jgi:hypothetical protein
MNIQSSQVKSYISPRAFNNADLISAVKGAKKEQFEENFNCIRDALDTNCGIGFSAGYLYSLNEMISKKSSFAMDALQPTVFPSTISTPVQFLQEWLPGFVQVITAKRLIDELVGISILGDWNDSQVVQSAIELTSGAIPYSDNANINLADFNPEYVFRSVVNFMQGMTVGIKEEKNAAKVRINTAAEKRNACALSLEIIRNAVGFFGYNNGANATYGFLTDPSLPAYNTVAIGAAASTQWASKTFLEIVADIRQMISGLRTQSQEQIDPGVTKLTLALATDVRDYLSVTSDFGISVIDWLNKTYTNVRVTSAPELNAANGGENVGYMYAENISDGSTDDGAVFIQCVPSKFLFLGVEQRVQGYVEGYSNATAGVMCKRPWAVYRVTGI